MICCLFLLHHLRQFHSETHLWYPWSFACRCRLWSSSMAYKVILSRCPASLSCTPTNPNQLFHPHLTNSRLHSLLEWRWLRAPAIWSASCYSDRASCSMGERTIQGSFQGSHRSFHVRCTCEAQPSPGLCRMLSPCRVAKSWLVLAWRRRTSALTAMGGKLQLTQQVLSHLTALAWA